MSTQAALLKRQLLTMTRHFLRQLGSHRAMRSVNINALLVDDLGLGSLERVELSRRLEQHFQVRLSQEGVMLADTMRDLYHLLEQARPNDDLGLPELNLEQDSFEVDLKDCQHLIDVFKQYCQADPDRIHACIIASGGQVVQLSYGQLWQRVEKLASLLRQKNLADGAVVALAVTAADAFMVSYFATILAGYQPLVMRLPVHSRHLRPAYWRVRLPLLVDNEVAAVLLQDRQAQDIFVSIGQMIFGSMVVMDYEEMSARSNVTVESFVEAPPHSVMYKRMGWNKERPVDLSVTHGQWLARVREDGAALDIQPSDVMLSWLSLVEPMGLLGAWLGSFYYGIPFVCLSPQTFFATPERWLWAIHQYRASISFAPNSGYAFCLQTIEPTDCVGLDLSCWRIALNAGERVHAETVQQFSDYFEPFGLAKSAMQQAYIPAGSAMLFTLSMGSRPPHYERIATKTFFNLKRAQLLPADMPGGVLCIASGKGLPSAQLRIVSQDRQVLVERQIGMIEFKLQAEADDAWHCAGDLGYFADQALYVVAADPNRIVKYGSYIPRDALDLVINSIPVLVRSTWLSFCADDAQSGQTRWVVMLAWDKWRDRFQTRRTRTVLLHKLAQCFSVMPDHILFVSKKDLASLGEDEHAQVQSAQAAYLAGELIPDPPWYHHRHVWTKVKALAAAICRPVKKIAKIVYTLYFVILMILFFLPTWCVVMALPMKWGKKIFKCFTKVLFILSFCPILVKGKAWIRQSGRVVFACNHTSYLDVLVLISVLPSEVCFVGKRELMAIPLLGSIFKKMGHLFVDPSDFARGQDNLQEVVVALEAERSVVIYPEGTFTHATGLRPFKLGAFVAAAQTDTPVCPVICKGLRTVFRDRETWLRPGVVRVIAKSWIAPQGSQMQDVLLLRDQVMEQIAEDCDEPILELVAAGPPVIES